MPGFRNHLSLAHGLSPGAAIDATAWVAPSSLGGPYTCPGCAQVFKARRDYENHIDVCRVRSPSRSGSVVP